jgi:hypothetical protein
MRSPALALAWELYRPNRWGLGAIALGLPACAVLCRSLPAPAVQMVQAASGLLFFLALLYLVSVFAYSGWDPRASRLGLPPHLLKLPLRTGALVAWPMLYGMAAAALLWLGAAWLVFVPSGLSPRAAWWPALLCAALSASFQALAWTVVASPLARLVVAVLVLPSGVLMAIAWGLVPTLEAALRALGLVIAASYFVALAGVTRARRGGGPLLAGLWRRLERPTARGPRRYSPFPSAARAQLWFEWRQKGLILPCLLGCFMLVMLLTTPTTAFDAPLLMRVLAAVVTLPLLLAFVVGFGMGKTSFWAKELGLSALSATRPVSSGALVLAKLRMAALSVGASLALMLSLAALWVALSGTGPELARWWALFWRGRDPLAMWGAVSLALVALPALTWGQVVGGLCVGLTGRAWVVNGVTLLYLAGAAALTALGVWVYSHPSRYDTLQVVLGSLVAVALPAKLLAAGWAARSVCRRGLMEARAVWGLVGVWVAGAFCLAGLTYLLTAGMPAPAALLALAVVLVLPLVRLVAAPLALAWDRHR